MKASAIDAWILALRVVCPAVAQNWDSGGYFANWFNRVDKTQAQQPHWITPLFTTTPRLEEEFRSDITWTPATGGESLNYGSGKGLELIPTDHTEIILGVPPYQVPAEGPAGGGNIPLLLKYRLLASNEQHSNYIVTAFLGGSIPAGRFATKYGSIAPTIAFGKGIPQFRLSEHTGLDHPDRRPPNHRNSSRLQHRISIPGASQIVAGA